MSRRNLDLAICSIVAVLGALFSVAGLHFGSWLSIFGILLVIVIPGYLASQWLFPVASFVERLLLSLGLSLAIVGLSGLILDFMPGGLSASTWGIWIGAIILIEAFVVWLRRRARGSAVLSASVPSRLVIAWKPLLLFGVAAALLLTAVGISQAAAAHLNSPLTLLWAGYDRNNSGVIDVGIQNQEGRVMSYRLVAQQNGVKLKEWQDVKLAPGQTASAQIDTTQLAQQPVVVLLYRTDQPGKIYRQVKVDPLQQQSVQTQGK